MSIAVEQVPMWLVLDRNIGHALGQTRLGWHLTACGTFTPNGEATKQMPVRICSKCRAWLAAAPALPTSDQTGPNK